LQKSIDVEIWVLRGVAERELISANSQCDEAGHESAQILAQRHTEIPLEWCDTRCVGAWVAELASQLVSFVQLVKLAFTSSPPPRHSCE
jgi:hypothetical protein